MSRRRPPARGEARTHPAPPAVAPAYQAPPLSPSHPAAIAALLAAIACVVLSATFEIYDTDFWQHLLVGKAIWQAHGVPRLHEWTWPGLGRPDVLPSWGFRALIWPFWAAGGVWGLFAFRWIASLAALGVMWQTARRMGARGLSPLFVVVLGSVILRTRSQVRPEALAAILLALEIAILETARAGGALRRAPAASLIAIAWAWINVHVSFPLFFVVLGIHALDARLAARGGSGSGDAARARRLAFVGLAALAASFLNPFGARAVWQPFEFILHQRQEPIFLTIGELQPPRIDENLWNGLPLLALGWPLLLAWRARRTGWDRVELMTLLAFGAMGASSARFLGNAALVAVPYAARDLDAWIRARGWPRWTASPWARAAIAIAASVLVGWFEWTAPDPRPGVGIEMSQYPVRACDFMRDHDVRGRGFNHFSQGGYLLWRFWPDPARLPFMDIHQSGTREDRLLYMLAGARFERWRALDARERFAWVLLNRRQVVGDHLLDFLDRDSTFALVFLDDAAALYARRGGVLDPLTQRGYRLIPGGRAALAALGERCAEDPVLRERARIELERQVDGSPWNAAAHSLLANIALMEHRATAARFHLERALEADPLIPRTHERLGDLALEGGDPRAAIREYRLELVTNEPPPQIELRMGRASEALGDPGAARAHYRAELKRDPSSREALDRLSALEARIARP